MRLAIAILLFVFTGSFQSAPEGIVQTQIINQEQLPARANTPIREMKGVYPRKITRNETSDKQVYFLVEMVSKDGKELYELKFDAKGSMLNTSIIKQGTPLPK